MADDDIRICPWCRAVYVEDSVLQLDPDVCPRCGGDLKDYGGRGDGEDSCD